LHKTQQSKEQQLSKLEQKETARMQLMRNRIVVETFWHPDVEKNRTCIRLNHVSNLQKLYHSCKISECVV